MVRTTLWAAAVASVLLGGQACDSDGGAADDAVGAGSAPVRDAAVGVDPRPFHVAEPTLSNCASDDTSALDATLTAVPVPELSGLKEWEGWTFHHVHWHNEGVGAWYFYPAGPRLAVQAPGRARLCVSVRDHGGDGPDVLADDGETLLVPDTRLELELDGGRRLTFDHLWVLADLADALELAGADGLEVAAGQLLGYTSAGKEALDLKYVDTGAGTNGLPPVDSLHELPWRRCPMQAFAAGSQARADLEAAWTALSYEPAVATRLEALDDGERSHRGYAELAADSCGTFDVDSARVGTIWGNWFNLDGPLPDGHALGGWYHYPRGTVTMLPNAGLNPETYTVGYAGEAGLWSEMLSYYWPSVDDRWFDTRFMVSLWLPPEQDPSAAEGCFMLSAGRTEATPDALWVYWTLDPASDDAGDGLTLTRTTAGDPETCLAEGSSAPAEVAFTRYPLPY